MELVNYLRIIRRRWRLVTVFLVLGVALGASSAIIATSPTPKGPGVTYYLAKHTLSSTDGANLSRNAAICTEQEVPRRVAAKLGAGNPQDLAGQITCEPHPETSLLYVAAADTDPKRAVLVADTFAEQLVAYLQELNDVARQDRIDLLNRQIQDFQNEYTSIATEVTNTTDKTQLDLLAQRQKDLAARINTAKTQLSTASLQPITTEALTTLSTADAVAISQAAYEALINADPSGQAPAKGASNVNVARQSPIDSAIVKANTGLGLPARAALGGGLGLFLGLLVVVVLDRVDPRIRTKLEAEEAFGWPVIGEIPPLTRAERRNLVVFAHDEPRSRSAEAYRVLRSALLFGDIDESQTDLDIHPIFSGPGLEPPEPPDPPDDATHATHKAGAGGSPIGQVIIVTSPGPSEGKTTTAANLAAIMAETGRSVLVVNCDFRRPRIHTHLGAIDEPRQVVDTKVPGVKLVTQVHDNPDEANPATVVAMQRQVIRNARTMFDIVLLDTAPLLTTNDATEVLQVADQVVIVAKAGKTHKEAADRAAELLERRNGPVIGVVLVGATDVPTARYYYYSDNAGREDPEPGTETASPFENLVMAAAAPTARDTDAPSTDAVFAGSGSAGGDAGDAGDAVSPPTDG